MQRVVWERRGEYILGNGKYIWGQKYFLLYTIKMSQIIELET